MPGVLSNDLYKKYFLKDAQGLTSVDYAARGVIPKDTDKPTASQAAAADSTVQAPDSTKKAGSEAITDAMIRRQEALKKYFDANEAGSEGAITRTPVTCPTFPFCNHIPAPPLLLPPPKDLENADASITYPWSRGYSVISPLLAKRKARFSNLFSNPLGENTGQVRPRWSPLPFDKVDSTTGTAVDPAYHIGMYAPAIGKLFHVSKSNPKNLETVQHKWKIVNEMPQYVGVDSESEANYGDWDRSSSSALGSGAITGKVRVKSVGEWYKSKDPTLTGLPGEKAGGLAVGDLPEPPAMAGPYVPPDQFDPTWKSASESEQFLNYGANFIRE